MTYEPPAQSPEVDFSDDAVLPRSRRLRWAAAALALVLAAGAGIGFVVTGHTSPASSGRATATTSPNALNHDPAPSLAGAYSDDIIVAFRALYAYGNWATEHPSTDLASNYTDPGGPIYSVEQHNLEFLVSHSAHYPSDPRGYEGDLQFVKITLVPKPVQDSQGHQVFVGTRPAMGPALVTAVVTYLRTGIYTNIGRYLQVGQQAGTYALSYSLRQSSSGQWRLYSVVQLHPVGGPLSLETSA